MRKKGAVASFEAMDDERLPSAKMFVAEKGSSQEQASDGWPCRGRALNIADATACTLASRGQAATLSDKSGEWQLITDLEHLVSRVK